MDPYICYQKETILNYDFKNIDYDFKNISEHCHSYWNRLKIQLSKYVIVTL